MRGAAAGNVSRGALLPAGTERESMGTARRATGGALGDMRVRMPLLGWRLASSGDGSGADCDGIGAYLFPIA